MREALPVPAHTSSDEDATLTELNAFLLGVDKTALIAKDLEDKTLENQALVRTQDGRISLTESIRGQSSL